MLCSQCQHENPPQASSVWNAARLACRAPCGTATPLLPSSASSAGSGRSPGPPARFASPESYTPQAPRREDPHLQGRARRRAQAGHRALRRPQGLDGAARRPRSRGGAQAPRSRARADDGGGPPLRGHGQPGDGRRHHGAVRRAARPRGPRRARLLRRAAHAGGGPAVRRGGAPRARRARSRSASGSTPARWWCARSAATCAWTTRRSGRPPTWPRGWSSSPTRARSCSTPATLALVEGYVQVDAARARPGQGPAEPVEVYELVGAGRRARGSRRPPPRADAVRRPRRRARAAPPGARAARGTGHGQVVALVGEPGVGKSRLVWEFTHSHRTEGWLVLEAARSPTARRRATCRSSTCSRAYFRIERPRRPTARSARR